MADPRDAELGDNHDGRHEGRCRNLAPDRLLGSLLAMLALLALPAMLASSASAAEPIESFSITPSTTQAGGHPNLQTSFSLQSPGEPETAKSATLSTPAGVFANPNAVAQCTAADFALEECPVDSQAGLVTVYANHEANSDYLLGTAPVYDLEPGPEQTARFAFIVPTLDTPVTIPVSVRTASDYGLRLAIAGISEETALAGADLSLWGVPAEPAHDSERFTKGSPGNPAGCPGLADSSCIASGNSSNLQMLPLIDNPTTCTRKALSAKLEVETYGDSTSLREASFSPTTGCDQIIFNPSLNAQPTTTATDSPSGLSLDLNDLQQLSPTVLDSSELRDAAVELPAGLRINPAATELLGTCSEAQANFGSEGPAECPENSEIGTLTIESPSLSGPLEGTAYLGEAGPGDPYRIFETASGFGMNVKFVSSIFPNPETGQLIAELANLSQVPFEEFKLDLSASEPTLFITPAKCGMYEVKGTFTPWDTSLSEELASQYFGIDSGPDGAPCPGPAARLTVSLSPQSILANGASTTEAIASVSDAEGNPIPGDELEFSSSDAGEQIGPVTDNGDGTYTAQITASKTAGTPTITATDDSVSPAVIGHSTLTQIAGPPAQVAVSLTPASILANGSSTTTATAKVSDANRNLIPGASVAFASTDGAEQISATSEPSQGTYTAQITSSTEVGTPTITATDTSVMPRVFGTAMLDQLSAASPGPGGSTPIETPMTSAACVVPRLKGKTLKAAERELRSADCRLGKVKGKRGRSAKVAKQNPVPAKVLIPGASVDVTVK
jgi:Invasin, domain 3